MKIKLLNSQPGLIRDVNLSDRKRGAALILEIIIYLVIVALIAVAVTSGVRAVRDLVFTSHGKSDLQTIASWLEGKYSQDGKYPAGYVELSLVSDSPTLTTANGVTNEGIVNAVNGADSGWCAKVKLRAISNPDKSNLWISSNNPSKYMQSGTSSHPGGISSQVAPTQAQTGSPIVCPAWTP